MKNNGAFLQMVHYPIGNSWVERKKMDLKVVKIRKEAQLPTRAYPTDAGLDLYFCPNGERDEIVREEGLAIEPRDSMLIPTGLRIEVPYGYMLEIKNKSGIAYKRQLVVGACVVDPGYEGEIYVNLHNIGFNTQYLKSGAKIAQAVLIQVNYCTIREVSEEEFSQGSPRGNGGFGSTGDE